MIRKCSFILSIFLITLILMPCLTSCKSIKKISLLHNKEPNPDSQMSESLGYQLTSSDNMPQLEPNPDAQIPASTEMTKKAEHSVILADHADAQKDTQKKRISTVQKDAQKKRISAEGMSEISFKTAIRDAMRNAVEQGAGVFIHSKTEIENFEVQKDKIVSKTEGYILGYKVIDKKEAEGLYTVKIEADISLDKVRNDLIAMRVIWGCVGNPKLMVLIEENYSGLSFEGTRIAETALISLLREKEFEIVDKEQVVASNQQEQAIQALAGNMDAAKALGLMFGAQYIILGKAMAQKSGEAIPGSGFNSMHTSLSFRILHSQSGLILGSGVKRGVSAHISELAGATEAFKKASKKAVDTYILDKIFSSWNDFCNNGLPLRVNISGVKAFTQCKEILSFLESLDQVAACKREKWNRAGGILVLSLRFKGLSEELAELADMKKTGKGTLMVEDFAPEKIDMALEIED